MTTTLTPGTQVLPIGQFFGTFHPKPGEPDHMHRVRVKDGLWELDDEQFAVWGLLHGLPDKVSGGEPWTREAVRAAATELADTAREQGASGPPVAVQSVSLSGTRVRPSAAVQPPSTSMKAPVT